MAKEKFIRSKPHVNFLDGLKQKLGLSGETVEPPIEPLDEAAPSGGEAADLGGWAKVSGLETSLDPMDHREGGPGFNPEQAQGPSAVKDSDGDVLPEAEDGYVAPGGGVETAGIASFSELQGITTAVEGVEHGSGEDSPGLWQINAGEAPGHVPPAAGSGLNAMSMDDSAGATGGPVPVPYPNAEAAGLSQGPGEADTVDKNETITIHGARTEDATIGGNQQLTVGAAQTEGAGDGDPDQPLVQGGVPNPADGAVPETQDEVLTGFEHGTPPQPYVLGGLYNGEDAPAADDHDALTAARFQISIDAAGDEPDDGPSTLAVLDEQTEPAALNAGTDFDAGDVDLAEDAGAELDD